MGSGPEKWWKDKRGNKLINDAKIIFPHMKKLARPRNELFRLLCKNILEVINNLRRMLSLEKYDTSGKNANNEYILNFRINIIAFENSFHWALPMQIIIYMSTFSNWWASEWKNNPRKHCCYLIWENYSPDHSFFDAQMGFLLWTPTFVKKINLNKNIIGIIPF